MFELIKWVNVFRRIFGLMKFVELNYMLYIYTIITFFIVPTKISTPIEIQKTKYNSMF